jgi:hypothetical protein
MCKVLPAAAHLLIVTISRRRSSFWKAKSKLRSAALNRWCGRARSFIFRPTHRTSSATHPQNQCGCYAFARQPAKRTSSRRSALPSRLGPRRRPCSTRRRRRSSERSPRHSPQGIGRRCFNTHEVSASFWVRLSKRGSGTLPQRIPDSGRIVASVVVGKKVVIRTLLDSP